MKLVDIVLEKLSKLDIKMQAKQLLMYMMKNKLFKMQWKQCYEISQ